MSEINPTRRTGEPPSNDGATLAGWPVTITAEEATALQTALGELEDALDAVVRERDEALAEVERLRCTSRDLLDTLSAAVRSGDFALSGSEDMAEFVRQALRNLEEIAR